MKKKLLVCLFLTIVLCTLPSILYAQENTPSPFDSAKQLYLTMLETYRVKEQEFSIAREQYAQVQTLASLEVAVQASKNVQFARIDTLTAYFNTLLTYIANIKGLELTKKTVQQQAIQKSIDDLQTQRSEIEKATDRIQLDAQSAVFAKKQESYISVSYQTLALAKIALYQSAIDQLRIVYTQLREQLGQQNLDETTKTIKLRAFDEVIRTIEEADVSTQNAVKRYDQLNSNAVMNLNSYLQVIDVLSTGYAKILQAESFIKELAKQ